jgi:DNA repair protein RadC
MSVLQSQVRGSDDAIALLRELVGREPVEGMVVVGLDHEQRLCGVGINRRHRALTWVKAWELVDLAAEFGACALVVGLFPSGRSRAPSEHEIGAFVDLYERAVRAHVLVLDCLVVRGHRWWSLREKSGRFPKIPLVGHTPLATPRSPGS